jgi:hypothetical protein
MMIGPNGALEGDLPVTLDEGLSPRARAQVRTLRRLRKTASDRDARDDDLAIR